MKKQKLNIVTIIAMVFTFTFAGTAQPTNVAAKSSKITVTYTLKKNNKKFAKKKVKLAKKGATVIKGLRKAWKVKGKTSPGLGFMVTGIKGKNQNTSKGIYWTYKLNGKFANKGVSSQKVHNKDRVVFNLAK
ncbi:DUF4430 domain-containing protein [Lactobacillus sp. ESL0684]|uniref:DUF4430 domain-containing protein n=1 Tax=Lactobacillus sp. ESL0684 TaxID=2983213 RepID=UPI0023F9DE6A|nr:DUF4430 domain-containing protein [Lactobacillus sp. ESL0684]WEV43691.1 DUF4430 domain-containing protein [Lactobacillus sp. ESL0684]